MVDWTVFADEGMLTLSDVASLANGDKLPVVTALTCIIGNFAVPGNTSLGEALTLHAKGGSIATWSPTGLSVNSPAMILNDEFMRGYFAGKEIVLGEVVRNTLRHYQETEAVPFMLEIYNLLGDPSILGNLNLRYEQATGESPGKVIRVQAADLDKLVSSRCVYEVTIADIDAHMRNTAPA